MSDSERDLADRWDEHDDDEIEIIEIVGLDDDSPAASRVDRLALDGGDDDELVIELDDDEERADPIAAPSDVPDPTVVDDNERFARLSADFENLRKRMDRERVAHERHAGAQLVARLLPVLDNFERALSNAREAQTDPRFSEGVAMIFRQLLDELRKEGLVAVDTVGEPFDPAVHEAVATTEHEQLPPNTVVEELQRGYLLHDRLLRPALVKVTVDPANDRAPGEPPKDR
ncbi:MAG TPA: nucleotide exchange factor GrpE [Candidatus Polarisedimenticolaceae bacterium]|nr:nucleotide exchange factor GrpE [Candidatus Polarisedimenticolaceae bacterium]